MKAIKIGWAVLTNAVAIIVILAMFHVVNGPFETVVVVGLVLIYNQLVHSFRIDAIQSINYKIRAHNEFITLARLIKPVDRYRNPETNKIQTDDDDVTPHEVEHKEMVEGANKLVETTQIEMLSAGAIWAIAVWQLIEVVF